MSKQPVQPHVVRGLTTLQLLELAGIIVENQIHEAEDQRVAQYRASGMTEDAAKKRVAEDLKEFNKSIPLAVTRATGVQLPIESGSKKVNSKIKKWLSAKRDKNSGALPAGRYAWFAPGGAKGALRAITPEGQAIEGQRQRLYAYVSQNVAYVTEPGRYRVNTAGKKKGTAGVQAVLSRLDDVLATSFSFGTADKTPQLRQQAFNAVWAVTQAGAEPADVERAVGGGGKAASQADVLEKTGATSGLLALKVRKVLAKLTSESRTVSRTSTPLSAGQKQARAAVAAQLRAHFRIPAGETAGSGIASAEQQMGDTAAVFRAFQAAVGNNGDQFWRALGKGEVNDLLTGQGVRKPRNPLNGKTEHVYNPDAQPDPNGAETNPAGFTRYVFSAMANAYMAAAGAGDVLNAAAQKSSDKRRASGPRATGMQGIDQPIFNPANAGSLRLENKMVVAKFIRAALQGKYTLEALRRGAELLGVRADPNVVLPATLAQNLADHILREYAAAVSNVAEPDFGALSAAAAALRISGYSKWATKDAASAAKARASILQTYDAYYGVLTGDCSKLTTKSTKYIASAVGAKVAQGAKKSAICQAIQGKTASGQTSQQLSSGRRQNAVPYKASTKAAKSKSSGGERSVLDAILGAPQGQQAQVGSGGQPGSASRFPQQPSIFPNPVSPRTLAAQQAATQQPMPFSGGNGLATIRPSQPLPGATQGAFGQFL